MAPLWKPNLDDGVVINFAPLWRLVPQNKSWQKELKSTWDALCAGSTTGRTSRCTSGPSAWSRSARTIGASPSLTSSRTCSRVEGTRRQVDRARRRPTRSHRCQLVRERTSPAVKAALKSLLERAFCRWHDRWRRMVVQQRQRLMDKDTRNAIERATQRARTAPRGGLRRAARGRLRRAPRRRGCREGGKPPLGAPGVPARAHRRRHRAQARSRHERGGRRRDYLRDAAFTTLNRFVALKMLEARELVQECITKGEQSAGFREFCGLAPGLQLLPGQRGLSALHRVALRRAVDRGEGALRPPRPVVACSGRSARRSSSSSRSSTRPSWPASGARTRRSAGSTSSSTAQDERSKMREESQAPRNSRELAVRNQFFTPRYVVQFLTDNTLGRIWYEMRGTKTVLARALRVHGPQARRGRSRRARRRTRATSACSIPACGSGHFLLYAFDLLLAIYEEAYADPREPDERSDGQDAREDYPSLDALRKAVPGLVLAHNLHGVDIDPRCAQIAQLALWMRAQQRVSRLRHRSRRAPADPTLEHRHRRAARRRRPDRQGVRREAWRCRARARVHGARRGAQSCGRYGAAPSSRGGHGSGTRAREVR